VSRPQCGSASFAIGLGRSEHIADAISQLTIIGPPSSAWRWPMATLRILRHSARAALDRSGGRRHRQGWRYDRDFVDPGLQPAFPSRIG
jgi:hypothetical protein